MPQLGDVIRGKYRITGKLGEGGMGVVFQALHVEIDARVAMKILRPEMLDDPENVARFDRESRAVSQLRGEHIARVLDVDFAESGLPFIVMELLEGRDLSSELELRSVLPADEAVDYVLQACTAMTEAHALGIIHRDLKPSNLFISDTGGTRMVKVLDFGISKIVDDEVRMTMTQATFGTPLYMSPEQVRSTKLVDARTDVWSLGIILYELLSGRTPFVGNATAAAAAIVTEKPPSLKSLRADLPPGLEDVVMKALEKDPAKRWQDVASFARALKPFAPDAPISGGRLAAVQREAESNRAIKVAPARPEDATVVNPARTAERNRARRSRAAAMRRSIAAGAGVAVALVGVALAARALLLGPRESDPATSAAALAPPATMIAPPVSASPPVSVPLPAAARAAPPSAPSLPIAAAIAPEPPAPRPAATGPAPVPAPRASAATAKPASPAGPPPSQNPVHL